MLLFLTLVITVTAICFFLHWYSYRHLKSVIVSRRRWDLNICCGNVDGGGVNADIVQHSEVPNFVEIQNIYQLPFEDGQFEHVLCSHTAEHIDDPDRFDRELRRVGKHITYVLPPIWDLGAALNVLEHR
ncbi:MAG: methyltransferase domain-containing protein [Pseudomonadota bacterium]